MKKLLKKQRTQRKNRVRAKIRGTTERPRLSLFRSNRYIYAQIINDESGKTLVFASSLELNDEASKDRSKKKDDKSSTRDKIKIAKKVGEIIAKRAKERGVKKAVVDRGFYCYHGNIKALVEGARDGGLKI